VIVFEASARSTGLYGVEPEQMHGLLTQELGYRLSTMKRWLAGGPPMEAAELRRHWHEDSEYYYIAYPRVLNEARSPFDSSPHD
jgi:hypothetical protein